MSQEPLEATEPIQLQEAETPEIVPSDEAGTAPLEPPAAPVE